jgi:hypothetical protein
VLDSVNAGHDRAADALVAGRVRRDRAAGRMCGLHQGVELVLAEGGPGLAARAGAIVGIDLDPVGAGGGLLADGGHHLGVAAGLLRALRQVHVGAEALARAVGAGGDDGAGGHEQARARHDPLVDGALQAHVGVPGAFGAEVAQGGEAAHQGARGVTAGAERPVGGRLLQHLIVPQRLVVGVQQQVRVQLDQAGDQGLAGQGDDLCVGRRGDLGLGPDRADLAGLDHDDPAPVRRRVPRAPHRVGLQQVARRLRGGGCGGAQRDNCAQYGLIYGH